MKLNEIKKKAQWLGIEDKKLRKVELIHAIQTAEGYVMGRTRGIAFRWVAASGRTAARLRNNRRRQRRSGGPGVMVSRGKLYT